MVIGGACWHLYCRYCGFYFVIAVSFNVWHCLYALLKSSHVVSEIGRERRWLVAMDLSLLPFVLEVVCIRRTVLLRKPVENRIMLNFLVKIIR